MKQRSDRLSLVAVFLLIFLFVVGATIWLLDLIVQQRIFGLLVSAEFVAFAMIVYLYYEETPQDISRKWLLSGFAALTTLVLLAAALFVGFGSAPQPNVQVTLYAGEVSDTEYGFGNSSTMITSPGPTLTFKVGDVVNMTLINVGKMPHNWIITDVKQVGSEVLFGAEVASDTAPLLSNQTASHVFTITQAGSYFYLCEISGHLQLGMWGNLVVNP
jgi:plastocyanin